MGKGDTKSAADATTDAIPELALTHGQTIWLMTELGLHQGASRTTFNYYIKSLRKLGIPFDKGKGQSQGHRHVTYDFEDLMELTVALLLRVYGTLPDSVLAGLRNFRSELRPVYRLAYCDCAKTTFPPAQVEAGQRRLSVNGVFLDLNIRYSAGRMIAFGPPRVLSAFEAIATFARAGIPARSYLPLNITAVADMIVLHTRTLPSARRPRGTQPVHLS